MPMTTTRLGVLVLAAATLGCSGGGSEPAAPTVSHAAMEDAMTTPKPPTTVRLEGIVRIAAPHDPLRAEQRFAGVMLETDDGTSWVVGYHADPLWEPFRDHRVVVDGVRVTPDGGALTNPHLEAHAWRIMEKSLARFVAVGPVEELAGTLGEHVGEPGTKEEGERTTTFSSGGQAYALLNAPADGTAGARTLRVRRVELSRYAAHGHGDVWLWVVE
jgi:hypothetical protein